MLSPSTFGVRDRKLTDGKTPCPSLDCALRGVVLPVRQARRSSLHGLPESSVTVFPEVQVLEVSIPFSTSAMSALKIPEQQVLLEVPEDLTYTFHHRVLFVRVRGAL